MQSNIKVIIEMHMYIIKLYIYTCNVIEMNIYTLIKL